MKILAVVLAMAELIGIPSVPLLAQKDNQPSEKDFSLRVPVELVLVPVTVEDQDGMPIAGLSKEDFLLTEEAAPQLVSYFSADPFPMSVAILIDRSADAQTLSALGQTLLALTESYSPFDELAIYQFENTLDQVQDFSTNKDEVQKSFKRISFKGHSPAVLGGPFGNEPSINGIPLDTGVGKVPPPKTFNTHITDAIFGASMDLRRRSKDRRKIILVISNGQNAPGNRHSYDDTVEVLLRNEVVVYGIAQGSALLYRKGILNKFANASGGSVWHPFGEKGFSETYSKIAQLARNQYVLGYVPKAQVETVTYRRIQVEVRSSQTKVGKVRCRKGYYAIPHL